jgi:putative transcriptional regulator
VKKELFAELLDSVREGGAILRGEVGPARVTDPDNLDVRSVRENYGLTQPKFAALMGISVATLRNWEQGRRQPEGSARVLLRVVATSPEAVLAAVASGAPNKSLQRTPTRRSAARRRR